MTSSYIIEEREKGGRVQLADSRSSWHFLGTISTSRYASGVCAFNSFVFSVFLNRRYSTSTATGVTHYYNSLIVGSVARDNDRDLVTLTVLTPEIRNNSLYENVCLSLCLIQYIILTQSTLVFVLPVEGSG